MSITPATREFSHGMEQAAVSQLSLSGVDAEDIQDFLIDNVLLSHVQGLPEGPAKKLYLELDSILDDENAEAILRARTKALSAEDKTLYAKYLLIRNTCKSASSIIAATNASSTPDLNPYQVDNMISLMKQKGVSGKQLGAILGTVTQWKTGTSHPTQHLSEEGKQLFRDLLAIVNMPAEERGASLQGTVKKMFDAKMTRSNRMTVREETKVDRAQAKLHRQGQRKTYSVLKTALDKHYPDDAPNLLAGEIKMTLPYHTWNGGGDADGKSNADKKALLEGMVGYTLDAVEEHLDDIKKAITLDPSLKKHLEKTQKSLETAFQRLSEVEQKLYDESGDIKFFEIRNDFAAVYKDLSVDYEEQGDLSVNSESEMYEKLTKNLRHIIDGVAQGDAKIVLEESLFVMRQYKDSLTTAKIEKRANGLVDVDIMNRLFGHRSFQSKFLTGEMKRKLANKVFTSLSSDEQRAMMRHVGKIAKNNPEEVRNHYQRVFPEGVDDKGFPNQLRERGERLALQAITPNKFGMSIVAEAGEMSAEYAFFLGEEIYGVGNMMHTMLNEDMETLEKSPDFLIDFTKYGGLRSVANAAANNPRLAHYLEKHGVMLPCSDSVKQLGPGALYLQAQAINLLMRFAVENNKTICIKWGNGQVLTRGGGNAHIPGRLKAQALQWHLNGRMLDPSNPADVKILANVMFASNTEQGRAADFMSPNATRISRNQLKMISEMLGRSLELMGKVEKGTYIPQVAKFSSGARRVFGSITKNVMMRGYENFRDGVDENNNRLSDNVADNVSNMKIAGDANQAARPDSKAVEGGEVAKKKGKPLYDLRAIGTTIAISHMRTYHDGWFSLGAGLQAVHMAHQGREIGDGDLKVFLTDPLWASMVKNGLRTASLSDMPHAFGKLNASNWSHNMAMKVGKSVYVIPPTDPRDPPLFTYDNVDGTVTPEQAYMAKLYYDQALFVTYTEMLAEMTLTGKPLPQKLNDVEQAAQLHLDNTDGKIGRFQVGKHTNELFPFVDQDLNGNRREMLATQVLSDVSEASHDTLTQEQRYLITAAQRATQVWNNSDLYLDQDAYGSPYPVWKNVPMTPAYRACGCTLNRAPS